MKKTNASCWMWTLVVMGAGCVDPMESSEPSGNDTLGIAEFVVEESPDRTTVTGLAADGAEVGRLELVHGRFALSPMFADDYETPEVEGRKLDVAVLDQQLLWETAGFEPTLEMPSHPPSQWALTAFLDDPHTKAILDRWQIGFQSSELAIDLSGERAFVTGSYLGKTPQTCNNSSTCGTAYNGTINTCGGGAAATKAARVTQTAGTNCGVYTSSYNQVVVEQCCPTGSGGQSNPWFAIKACPTTSSNGTMCGTRTAGACKGCAGYPAAASSSCTAQISQTGQSCNGAIYAGYYAYQ